MLAQMVVQKHVPFPNLVQQAFYHLSPSIWLFWHFTSVCWLGNMNEWIYSWNTARNLNLFSMWNRCLSSFRVLLVQLVRFINTQEFEFSACCLMYISVKFHEITWNGLKVTEQIQLWLKTYLQCSKGYNSKSMWNIFTVLVFCMLSHGGKYFCKVFMKLSETSFQVTEPTQVYDWNHYLQCSKGSNCKSRQTRVYGSCVLHVN